MLDYLAEVTMSILQKQRARDPKAGYARDFVVADARDPAGLCRERTSRCSRTPAASTSRAVPTAIADVARELGLQGKVKIGVVTGDDVLDKLDDLLAEGVEINNMETGEPLSVDPRQGPVSKCLSRSRAARRSSRQRCATSSSAAG